MADQTVTPEEDPDPDAKWYRQPWMSDNQWKCAKMLASAYKGFHHIKAHKIKAYRCGIQLSVYSGFSTFDCDTLTRLVVLAHDRCIRLEIGSSGPGLIRLMLHAREREGGFAERHPTLEDHVAWMRKGFV